jgi:hypothetical protein
LDSLENGEGRPSARIAGDRERLYNCTPGQLRLLGSFNDLGWASVSKVLTVAS